MVSYRPAERKLDELFPEDRLFTMGPRRVLGDEECMASDWSDIDPAGRASTPVTRGEWRLLVVAAALAFILGALNLAKPSLWHDELVHVFVAKSVATCGRALLPSGDPIASAPLYHALLAPVVRLFGDGEFAMRFPSVLLATVNVFLAFFTVRPLLGRATALVTAFALALSPWSVAWSREARFYTLQQTAYLCMILITQCLVTKRRASTLAACGVGALCVYLCGIAISLHSVLFLAPLGTYAFLAFVSTRRIRSRWMLYGLAVGAIGAATMMGYYLFLPRADSLAIFKEAGLGGTRVDPLRASHLYYLDWLGRNLSVGFLALALIGYAGMIIRERRRGLFAALAFWAPVLCLSFLVSYRRPRFMYFAFPFYVAAFSYGLVMLCGFLPRMRRSWKHAAAGLLVLAFLGRLAVSAVYLVGDSVDAARGADTTLARRHPQWREPCRYVRERLDPDTAVLTTTYLPVLYYVGRVDNWYPSKWLPQEVGETGLEGLHDVAAIEAFVAEHPKGYFIAEWWRFDVVDVFPQIADDNAWVRANMTRIDEASSKDVTVYAWGMADVSSPHHPAPEH
ncbi:MAG TPA: glycosyltransferase family 39 protein [Candidatus Hydrogenedentes bacterium]|nr:glycosyltransferase family 39 protein [Candidatus Hydrogenedentota bacterium]HPG68752.1 glycosyltransferase family 39 protein [Candidatus Hydrogenedentota bacterium]